MFYCTFLYVHSSIVIILMGKRELVALLYLSSWCLVMVERLFLAVPRGCLRFVIVVFPGHTHLLFLIVQYNIGLKIVHNKAYQNLYFMIIYFINSNQLLDNLILVINSKRLSNII